MRNIFPPTLVMLSIVVVLVTGCGRQTPDRLADASASMPATKGTESLRQLGLATLNGRFAVDGLALDESLAKSKREAEVAGVDRQIIYEAMINLVVDDFAKIDAALAALVKKYGGYFAEAAVERTSGEQRDGRWVARIPADRFETFLDAVAQLGMPESRQQTAQDVTEEFVDLDARIANKRRLEKRLAGHLEDSGGEVKDLVALERELSRVRGEIEQIEGRLNYLTNRTELTTVTINAREERDYVPPQSPTFTANVSGAWGDSLASLRATGESAVVTGVYAFPWLIVLGVVATPLAWGGRRMTRRSPLSGEGADAPASE